MRRWASSSAWSPTTTVVTGAGLRSKKRFRLEDCADDAVAVADELGIQEFVPVGYSMGGPVAQLIWRRHRERVLGLVLCATAPGVLGRAARTTVISGRQRSRCTWPESRPNKPVSGLTDQLYLHRKAREWDPWAVEEASGHDWRMLLEAGTAIGAFDSTPWISNVDVPTSLVVTMRDQTVSKRRQTLLFDALPDAEVLPDRRRS